MALRIFEFVLWLADEPRDLLEWTNRLYDAGADDCSPGVSNGQPYVAFHREANSFEEAVRSAHRDVQTAGCRVLRCEIEEQELASWP